MLNCQGGVSIFPKKIFSERLAALRKAKNIPAKEVAEALGVTKAAISQLESAKNAPSAAMLIALADFLDVSLDYLTGRSDDPERH